VRVGDNELHAGEAARHQRAKERAPERLRLCLADVECDHLAVARLVHPIGEHETLAHDPAAVSNLLHLRIKPQVRVAALQRPLTEGVDLLVEPGADPGDLALGDPQPQRLDDLIDLPGRHAGHVRLLHHRHQRLL
jgi:hypothetical protein